MVLAFLETLLERLHWGEFPELLQEQYPHARILSPDIPGNGSLNYLISPNSISAMTDALRSQVSESGSLRLIAISMGGMIAIDWMTRCPEEVSSAVLINTSLGNISPFYQRLSWRNYFKVTRLLLSTKSEREVMILELTSNAHAQDNELIQNWQNWQQEKPVSGASALNQLFASATYANSSIPVQPVLIISSPADRLVDCRCSQMLQKIWIKYYQEHSTAGRDLPLDDPDWLVDTIRQWFIQQ